MNVTLQQMFSISAPNLTGGVALVCFLKAALVSWFEKLFIDRLSGNDSCVCVCVCLAWKHESDGDWGAKNTMASFSPKRDLPPQKNSRNFWRLPAVVFFPTSSLLFRLSLSRKLNICRKQLLHHGTEKQKCLSGSVFFCQVGIKSCISAGNEITDTNIHISI